MIRPTAARLRAIPESQEFSASITENFNTPATAGNVLTTYSTSLDAYDNSSQYQQSNLTVHDGTLDIHLNTDGTGAAVVFGRVVSHGVGAMTGQIYGRFTMRFMVTGGANHGAAGILWPSSDVWSEGELDYPEGDFASTINVFHHPTPCDPTNTGAGGLPNCSSSDSLDTGALWTAWHTTSVEWTPSWVRYSLDGEVVKTLTTWIPSTNHRFMIQTAKTSGTVPVADGHLLIDYYSIDTYNG